MKPKINTPCKLLHDPLKLLQGNCDFLLQLKAVLNRVFLRDYFLHNVNFQKQMGQGIIVSDRLVFVTRRREEIGLRLKNCLHALGPVLRVERKCGDACKLFEEV